MPQNSKGIEFVLPFQKEKSHDSVAFLFFLLSIIYSLNELATFTDKR